MRGHREAGAIVLFVLLAPAASGLLRAADESLAAGFLEKARAAHARGNRRSIERLVAAEKPATFMRSVVIELMVCLRPKYSK